MFLTKPVVHEKILNDDPKKNQSIDIIDAGRQCFAILKLKYGGGRARITHTSILFVKLFCLRFSIYWYLYYLDNNYKLKNIKFRIRTLTIILIVDYSDVVSLVTQQIGYPATMKYIWHHHCSKTFIKECLVFDIFFSFLFPIFHITIVWR